MVERLGLEGGERFPDLEDTINFLEKNKIKKVYTGYSENYGIENSIDEEDGHEIIYSPLDDMNAEYLKESSIEVIVLE